MISTITRGGNSARRRGGRGQLPGTAQGWGVRGEAGSGPPGGVGRGVSTQPRWELQGLLPKPPSSQPAWSAAIRINTAPVFAGRGARVPQARTALDTHTPFKIPLLERPQLAAKLAGLSRIPRAGALLESTRACLSCIPTSRDLVPASVKEGPGPGRGTGRGSPSPIALGPAGGGPTRSLGQTCPQAKDLAMVPFQRELQLRGSKTTAKGFEKGGE